MAENLDANSQPIEEVKTQEIKVDAAATPTTDPPKETPPEKSNPVTGLSGLTQKLHDTRDYKAPGMIIPDAVAGIDLGKTVDLIGDFNVTDKDLSSKYLNALEKQAYDDQLKLHNDQNFGSQALGFLAQSVVGEIALGTIEGAGYLLDFEMWTNKIKGEETEFSNWLSDLAVQGKEGIRENVAIHMDPYKAGKFDMASSSWWLSNGVSVVSAVSILLPVAGWARGAAIAGKGMKYAATAAKATKAGKAVGGIGRALGGPRAFNWVDEVVKGSALGKLPKGTLGEIKDGLHKAVVSRHIEGSMEAAGVYREKKEELLGLTNEDGSPKYTEEEAGKLAADGASQTYAADWVMLLQDIPQYMALGKTKGLIRAAKDPKLLAAQAESMGQKIPGKLWKKAAYGGSTYAKQMVGEGFEEMYQFMAAEEGKHSVDVAAGIKKQNSLGERVGEYAQDTEMWTSAFFGALGGGAFQALGPKISAVVGKAMTGVEGGLTEAQARINAVNRRSEILKEMNGRLNQAAELDNDAAVAMIKEEIAFELAMNGAMNGNMQMDLDAFDQISKMSEEEAQAAGVSPEFKEDIEYYKERYQTAAGMFAKNQLKFTPNTVGPITQREFMLDTLARRIPSAEQEVRDEIESMGIASAMSEEGRGLLNSALEVEGGKKFIAGMEHQLKNNKNISKEDRVLIQESIDQAKKEVAEKEALLNETRDGSESLNETDKQVLATGSHYIQDIAKKQAVVSHLHHAMKVNAKEIADLVSKSGQEKASKELAAQLKATAKKAQEEVSKKKEEVVANNGKEPGGLSGADIEAGLKDGSIAEKDLSADELARLKKHREGKVPAPIPGQPANPENPAPGEQTSLDFDQADELGVGEDKATSLTPESIAAKVANGEELTPQEEAIYQQDKKNIDAIAETIDNNPPPVEEQPAPETSGKDLENVAEAIAHEVSETPANNEEAVQDDSGNWVIQADRDIDESMVPKLSWMSINNNRMSTEGKKDPRNIALTQFLEGDNSMDGVYFILEVDEEYTPWKKSGNSFWQVMKAQFAGKGAITNLGKVPVRAVMYRDGKKLLSPNGVELSMLIHNDDFQRKNADINAAHEAEVLSIKEQVVAAQRSGKRVRVEFDQKTKGNIKTERVDNKFAKNNPSDTIVDAVGSDWVYGHDNQFLSRDSGEGRLSLPLAGYTSARAGAIYIATRSANGDMFPMRLNVANLNASEAKLIYSLFKDLVAGDVYSVPVTDAIKKRIKESDDPRMAGLYKYLDLDNNAITYSELLNHLVFSGREATLGKGASQLWVARDPQTQESSLMIGDKKYSSATIGTDAAMNAIVEHLVTNRRRQVDVNMLSSKEYKQYLMDTGLVTTNAAITESRRPFIQPSVTYKDPSVVEMPAKELEESAESKKVSNPVAKTNIKLKELEAAKAKEISEITEVRTADASFWRPKTPVGPQTIYTSKEEVVDAIAKKYDKLQQQAMDQYMATPQEKPEVTETKEKVAKTSTSSAPVNQAPTPTTDKNITYTPKGKKKQSYTIKGNKIFNSKGKEVFAKDSVDRRKIFANLALAEGRAQVVTLPDGKKYVLNDKGLVLSVASGKIIKAENIINSVKENADKQEAPASEAAPEPTTTYEPVPTTSKMSDEDWNAFVDDGGVPQHVREQIVDDLIAGNQLDERQISVYQEVGGAIEDMLNERKKKVEGTGVTPETKKKLQGRKPNRKNPFATKTGVKRDQNFMEDEAANIRQLLPDEIAIELFDDYVRILEGGWGVVGVFQNGMIELTRGADRGTAYHEAFHAVYRSMTTAKDRRQLQKDARRIYPMPTAADLNDLRSQQPHLNAKQIEDLYYEEQMADDLGSHMYGQRTYLNTPKSYPKGIKGLFARLWSWMKNVFTNPKTVEGMFTDIEMGKYRTMPVNVTRATTFKAHKHYQPQQIRDITQSLVSLLTEDIRDIDNIDQIDYSTLEEAILDYMYYAEQAGNTESLTRLNQLHNELFVEKDTFFLEQAKAYMKSMGIKPETVDPDANTPETEDGDTDPETEDDGATLFMPKSHERSSKDTASANIKLLVALTDEMDMDGNKKMTGFLGLPKKADFSTLWNKLEYNLVGIVGHYDPQTKEWVDGYDAMVAKLKTLAQYHPELAEIADKLDNASEAVQTQFHAIFSRVKGDYIDHIISGTGSKPISKITSADNFAKESMIVSDWATTFFRNFTVTIDGNPVYNPDKVANLENLIVAYRTAATEYIRATTTKRTEFAAERTAALKAQRAVLGALGIYMKADAVTKVLDTFPDGGATSPAQADAYRIGEFGRKLRDTLTRVRDLKGAADMEMNPLEQEKFIATLASVEAEFTMIMGENMRILAGGKKTWVYQNNNFITKTIQRVKDGDTSYLDQVLETPFGTNSVWAAQLTGKDGEKLRADLSIGLFGNYREGENSDAGDKASNLKKPDQLNDVINKYLSGFSPYRNGKGIHVGLAEADKGQQWYIQGPQVIDSLIIGDQNGGSLMVSSDAPVVKIFTGYLADELNRWKAAWVDVHGENPIPEDQQLLYYHYNLDKDGNRTEGNAMSSYLFPNMDFQALGLVDENGRPTVTTAEDLAANEQVVSAVKQALLDRVQDDINVAVKYNVILRNKDGSLKNNSIDHNVVGSNNQRIQGKTEGSRLTNAIANYTINSMIANIESTKLFTGDPALYKKKGDGFEDFRKRIPAASSSGIDARIFKNKDGSWAVREQYTSATTDNIDNMPSEWLTSKANQELVAQATGISATDVGALFDPYNEVNRTDAQAWISFSAYKERLRAYGKWTPSHEEAFQRINDGKLAPEDVKMFAMPLKTVHTGLQRMPGGIMSMQYNKQSEAPLIPGIHDKTPLKYMMDAMEKQGVDHVIVLDGKKAGAIGTTDIADANFSPADGMKLNPVKLDYRNLYLQQDLTSKGVKDTLVGVQAVKNVMATVTPDRIYGDDMSGLQLLEDYNRTISNLSDIGLQNYLKKIGWDPATRTLDQKLLREALIEEFEGDVSDNVIIALKKGMPLDALPIRKGVQFRVNSMINKQTVKLKQMGGAFVQMSDFGIMGMEVNINGPVKDSIIFFKNSKEDLQPMRLYKNSKNEIKSKPAQVLIPHGPILEMLQKSIEIKYPDQGKTYKDLSHREINELIDKRALEGLIYRIPNQGPGSNDAIEIAGILPPEMGDTIIAYSEITTKTGSDFDIDKAFAILPNIYVDPKTGQIKATSINQTDKETGKKTQKGLQNRRLWLMRKMLMHPEAYAQVMSPLDSTWLSDLANGLFPAPKKAKDLAFYTGTGQLNTKALFDNAKGLVGSIANHMTHHAITVNEDIQYTGKELGVGKTKDGKSQLSVAKDVDGNPVEETLGAFMNAIVDAAKDPYISRANINQKTANVAFMLARTGANREFIMAFMGQPVLKRYVELMEINEGRISPTFEDAEGVRRNTLEQLLDEKGYEGTAEEFKEEGYTLRNTQDKVEISPKELIKMIEKPETTTNEMDLKILGQFIEWQEKSKEVSHLIRASKVDTDGATRTLTGAGIAQLSMEELIAKNAFTNLDQFFGFEITSDAILWNKEKMLGTYFKNSILAIREVMKDTFVSEKPAVQAAMRSITDRQGVKITAGKKGENIAELVMDGLFTAINDSEGSPFHLDQKELVALMKGTETQGSIEERITAAKKSPELADNAFIQNLAISPGAINLPWMSPKAMSKEGKDTLYIDWTALKKYEADSSLWRDLITAAFYTSGLQRSFGVFNEHIPTDILIEEGYIEFWNKKMDELADPNALRMVEDKVIRHMWKNNDLVPSFSRNNRIDIQVSETSKIPVAIMFKINPKDNKNLIIGKSGKKQFEYKNFIKIKNTDPETGSVSWALYRLEGYEGSGINRIPVYASTTKMGYARRGIKVFEYFKENNTTMFSENRGFAMTENMDDYMSTLSLPEPVMVKDAPANNYNVNVINELTPEQVEESKQRATQCAAGQ